MCDQVCACMTFVYVCVFARMFFCVSACVHVCGMVCAQADTRLMQARPAASRSASPVFESSEGGEESAYDDRMSLDHLCATCRAARVHACRASDHSGEPAASSGVSFLSPSPHSAVGADGGAPAFHADPLTRLCLQMEAPRQSLHRPLRRLCSQIAAPSSLAFGAVPEMGHDDDDDVFYLFCKKQKIGDELHIYLEEGNPFTRPHPRLATPV